MADEERYKEFEQYIASGEPEMEERARNSTLYPQIGGCWASRRYM